MAELHSEDLLELSLEDIKDSCGLGLDIGGTIAKIAYRSKKDFKNGEPIVNHPREGYGYVRLKSFPRDKLDQVLEFVRDNCDLTRNEDGRAYIHTTGLGGSQFQKKIEENFNAKLKNQTEFDSIVKTFHKLGTSTGKESVILPASKEGIKEGMELIGHLAHLRSAMSAHSEGRFVRKERNDDDDDDGKLFPCFLVSCGSGNAIMQVNEDGTFRFVDGVTGGGRTFVGLSSFLTGVKDFHELMEMASKGDGGTTDVFAKHLKSNGVDGATGEYPDLYSAFADDHLLFSFGQGTTKSNEDVKKEDLVSSLLKYIVAELVHTVYLNANLLGIKKAYFCGNFVNHDVTRRKITAQFTLKNWSKSRQPCQFGFIKHGGYLGAIGVYLAGSKTVK